MCYTLHSMDKQLKHIVKYVKSKGIKIVWVDGGGSYFYHNTPDTIFIAKDSNHGHKAAILHEYYHSRQFARYNLLAELNKNDEFQANTEYRAETFVIRCFKKLGIIYDKTFVQHCWRDRPDYLLEEYYVTAYGLLINSGMI